MCAVVDEMKKSLKVPVNYSDPEIKNPVGFGCLGIGDRVLKLVERVGINPRL